MTTNFIEFLPERCLELILDYLSLDDFNSITKCSNRLRDVGREVLRVREVRLHQVLRQKGIAKWDLLHPKNVDFKEPSPGQRFGVTLVYFENYLYLFGGATKNWTTFNDLWRFNMVEKRWTRIIPKGNCPPPRAGATGILYHDKLIIIGGFELLYSMHAKGSSNWDNLPWMYDFTHNEWSMVIVDTSLFSPLKDGSMSLNFNISSTPVGQSYCLMQNDQIILFGGARSLLQQSQGYHRQNPILPFGLSNDTLSFSISTSKLSQVNVFGDVKPMKRCGHSSLSLDSSRMLLLGGNLGPNSKGTEDMWLLTCVHPLIEPLCVCDNISHHDTSLWYWSKLSIEPQFQPLFPFLHQATVFTGANNVTSTLVVLGGASTAVETSLSPGNRSQHLIVHSVDLGTLPSTTHCDRCGGTVILGERNDGHDLRWSAPRRLCQDIGNAPGVRQGFGLVAAADSLLVYGGLWYREVCSRPVCLLNDLLVRDGDLDKDSVLANCELHRLTFGERAISL